ncbi:hypothetical protein ACFQ77_30370 [Streptomyces virginiae]|uniref:hypothetical protein n=1 Tax=Streptomyces virginiae TaxID=1961 RepID=UPI0036B0738B
MSKAMKESVLATLQTLKDRSAFDKAIREAARNQTGTPESALVPELFDRFWSLARGVDLDVNWHSRAGVPVRSAMIADTVAHDEPLPVVEFGDAHTRGSVEIGGFGIGFKIGW